MAANFRITQHRRSNTLYLKLAGDFDGTSALELIHALMHSPSEIGRIYIDTRGLTSLKPFGQNVFLKNCAVPRTMFSKLVFRGNYGQQIAPSGASLVTH